MKKLQLKNLGKVLPKRRKTFGQCQMPARISVGWSTEGAGEVGGSVKRNSSSSSRACGLMGQPEVKGAGRSMPEELLIYCFGGARQLAALPLNAIKNKGATAINNKENANGMDSSGDGD